MSGMSDAMLLDTSRSSRRSSRQMSRRERRRRDKEAQKMFDEFFKTPEAGHESAWHDYIRLHNSRLPDANADQFGRKFRRVFNINSILRKVPVVNDPLDGIPFDKNHMTASYFFDLNDKIERYYKEYPKVWRWDENPEIFQLQEMVDELVAQCNWTTEQWHLNIATMKEFMSRDAGQVEQNPYAVRKQK